MEAVESGDDASEPEEESSGIWWTTNSTLILEIIIGKNQPMYYKLYFVDEIATTKNVYMKLAAFFLFHSYFKYLQYECPSIKPFVT
jgi:hypothetical protein